VGVKPSLFAAPPTTRTWPLPIRSARNQVEAVGRGAPAAHRALPYIRVAVAAALERPGAAPYIAPAVGHPTEPPPLPVAARAFLDGDAGLLPGALKPDEAERLVDYLVESGDGERLARLAETPDRAVAKWARRGLHLLRTRGAPPPAERPRAFVVGPYAPGELPAVASSIDFQGARMVWLPRPAVDQGLDIFEAELSETRGLLHFVPGHLTRREWRLQVERLVADGGAARVPARHARLLIERAYEHTVAAGRGLPADFAASHLALGPVEPAVRHAAYERVAPLELAEARPQLASLHELPEVAGWIPHQDALAALNIEIGEVLTSKLVVSPEQKRERLAAAIDRTADRTVDDGDRERLATRLEETALLVAEAPARLLLAAAALTRDAAVPPSENPFLRRLYEKVVNPIEEAS
jgi:hypothetical protein